MCPLINESERIIAYIKMSFDAIHWDYTLFPDIKEKSNKLKI